VADGATTVFISGREFEDVFPVWNWRLIPGTPEIYEHGGADGKGTGESPPYTCEETQAPQVGGSFVGGVSDGTVGAASMDYLSNYSQTGLPVGTRLPYLHLHRTWFFLGTDVLVVANGTFHSNAQTSQHSTEHSTEHFEQPSRYGVTVSLDQRLLQRRPDGRHATAVWGSVDGVHNMSYQPASALFEPLPDAEWLYVAFYIAFGDVFLCRDALSSRCLPCVVCLDIGTTPASPTLCGGTEQVS
jgi:hypothetical protein